MSQLLPLRNSGPRSAGFALVCRLCAASAGLAIAGWLAAGLTALAGEAAPLPAVERAVVVGSGLRLGLANHGADPSVTAELVVTTRAAGRLVGSARHTIDPLGPGEELEAWIPLAIWGEGRPELRAALIREGCCTTRLWLEPGGVPLEIEHTLDPPAVGSAPPRENPPAP